MYRRLGSERLINSKREPLILVQERSIFVEVTE